jgi:MFS family permease
MQTLPDRESLPPAFVLKYYLYRATAAVGFTAPIWYLYLKVTTGSYALAAAANAVWWTSLILFEIPTGYVGDRIGHRRALILGTVVRSVATAAMALAGSFLAVAAVFVVWAVSSTLRSGTTDAWLYDLLGDRLDESQFARVRGRGGTVAAVTSAATALAGGYIAEGSMADAYLATGAVVALGLPVLLSFPTADDGEGDDEFTVLDAIPVLREQFSRPPLRSFVLLVALYSGVHWGVNFFVQPLTVELGFSRSLLGWMWAAFTLLGGVVSYFSGAIKRRIGVRRWFRITPLALGLAFLAVAAVPLLAIPTFFLMRAIRGAALPLANQFVNDHAGDVGRATVLSAAGMVYNLVTVPFELGAGALADVLGPVWTIGLFGGVLVVGAALLLVVGRPFERAGGGAAGAPAGEDPAAGD